MTRTVRRLRLRLPFCARSVSTPSLICLALSLAFGLMAPTGSSAAKVDGFLTHEDIAGRLILDQNGQQITMPTAHDRHPELASGSVPTYLAIPLHGGEHLPGSITTLETGSQAGQNPVGPLNFDSIVKTNLNTTLAVSKLAVVDTPNQNYLVEYLRRHHHSSSDSKLTLSTATGAAKTTVNQLNHLLNSGTAQFSKLTQTGMNDLAKLLHINSTKSANSTASLKPMLNLEAQTITGEVLPVPAPEPSTWMIFAGLLAAGRSFGEGLVYGEVGVMTQDNVRAGGHTRPFFVAQAQFKCKTGPRACRGVLETSIDPCPSHLTRRRGSSSRWGLRNGRGSCASALAIRITYR